MASPSSAPRLTLEERQWLHDKYERLAAEEGQLAGTRTSYFATIAAVLFTALVALAANLLAYPTVFVLLATLLSAFGILLGTVWAVLIHRTTDAQNLWRESARRLEELEPVIAVAVPSTVTLRSGEQLPIDLAQPFHSHATRFSENKAISLFDRVNPSRLTEILPSALIAVWSATLVVVWTWFLYVR